MPINQAQTETLFSWLEARGVKGCPACGGTSLTTGELVFVPAYGVSASRIPMVQLICDTCAHMMHFAAGPMGLVVHQPGTL